MFVSNASAESDHLLFGSQCMLEGIYEATVEIPRDSATSSQRKIVIDSVSWNYDFLKLKFLKKE